MNHKQLQFFINMSFIQSKIARSFDVGLGNGIGWNDFIILFHLSKAPEQKMRRIDLAERISMSPSGITRMLLPMEKIGLVSRETDTNDARVSFVTLAPGGKRLFEESLERAQMISEHLLPKTEIKNMKDITDIFSLFSVLPHYTSEGK